MIFIGYETDTLLPDPVKFLPDLLKFIPDPLKFLPDFKRIWYVGVSFIDAEYEMGIADFWTWVVAGYNNMIPKVKPLENWGLLIIRTMPIIVFGLKFGHFRNKGSLVTFGTKIKPPY